MSSADKSPNCQPNVDSLQAELNHFVASTERRLQSLAESLISSGQRIHVASHGDKVESLQVPAESIRRGQRVASDIADQEQSAPDPLSRLAAMKQRLAARMEDRNDRK